MGPTGTGTTAERRPARRRVGLSFSALLVFAVVALPVLVALRAAMPTIDLAYQVRAGEIMLDTGHLLRTDPFTFTVAGQPWLNQQWGAQILLALLYRAGEWELIALARAALVGVTFWLVYRACRARGAGIRPAAWLTLGGLVVAIYGFVPRPQLFAMALFALTLLVVAGRARHPRALWIVPGLVVLWANLHGSFFLAPLLLLLAWAEDRRTRAPSAGTSLGAALASLGAATLNPYGLRVWTYAVGLSTSAELRRSIEEWRPTNPLSPFGAVFFLSVIVVAVIVVRRHGLTWTRVAGLVVFAVVGATAIRGVIWWALAAPVLVADLFPADDAEDRTHEDEHRLLHTAVAAALVLVAIAFLPWFRPLYATSTDSGTARDGLLAYAPQRLVERVRAATAPGARLFVPETWASWFEFALPEDPVFVDPRIEIFPTDVWRDYDALSAGEDGWADVLSRWNVDVLVLSRKRQAGLVERATNDPGWDVVFEDADGVVLVRSPAGLSAP